MNNIRSYAQYVKENEGPMDHSTEEVRSALLSLDNDQRDRVEVQYCLGADLEHFADECNRAQVDISNPAELLDACDRFMQDGSVFIGESRVLTVPAPESIKTKADVESLILQLARTGNIFHFDDSASTIYNGGKLLFSKQTAKALEAAMEKAFEVCGGSTGLWEDMVRDVFCGYMSFSADGKKMYVVDGNGGPGMVKVTTDTELKKALKECGTGDGGVDEAALDEWFKGLKDA